MAIKLVYLKTGEYVVTDLYQAEDEKNRLVYVLRDPKQLIPEYEENKTPNKSEIKVKVNLITWPQFTKETTIQIFPDSMVTAVDPTDDLQNLYEESFNEIN